MALVGILPTAAVHAHGAWDEIIGRVVFFFFVATTLDVCGDAIRTVHFSTRFEARVGGARLAHGCFVASPKVYNTFVNARYARVVFVAVTSIGGTPVA